MKLITYKKLIIKFLNIFLESLPNKLKYRLKAKLRWIYSDKWGKKYFGMVVTINGFLED